MLKHDKNRSRLSILKQDISLLTMKLDSLQKQCNEANVLAEAKKHLNSAIMTIEASRVCHSSTSDFAVTKMCSPNANSEKQRKRSSLNVNNEHQGFYVTKKQRSQVQNNCTKPTVEEIRSSKLTLSHAEILVCGVCFKEDDIAIDDMVEWIECGSCGMWAHCTCVSAGGDDFHCANCA